MSYNQSYCGVGTEMPFSVETRFGDCYAVQLNLSYYTTFR